MAIYKIHKTKDYTIMSNYHLQDKEISLKAKGLLSLMFSLPSNWNYSIKGLESICKESKDTINGIIHELEDNNYIERKRIYCNGKISEWEYNIYERKDLHPKKQEQEKQEQENKDVYKELNNKELNNKSSSSETIFDFIENGFGRTLNPIEYEAISKWEDNELTRYAITQAVLNNKYSIKYIQGILKNFEINNIKTIAEAQETKTNKPNKQQVKNIYDKTPSCLKPIETIEEFTLTDEERKYFGIN